ncbi:MAG: transcription-repair coupling factor [Vicinamibacteraceae bacterium]|nr:transcription-repair coupling factor [Vicinamibacteraceae bacterium]
MSTTQSLSFRALLKNAAGRIGVPAGYGPAAQRGPRAARITGLTWPAQAFYAAAAATQGPVLLVVASDRLVERMVADARFFLAALEGYADVEVERRVLPFPSHEIDPYRGLPLHFDVATARARALYGLASHTASLVVASVRALMPRVSPPERLLAAGRDLDPGDEMDPTALGSLLAMAGFTREDPVDEHGEFCVRGGVVDFFPPGDASPLRIEFLGDTIESVRRFDPATQRSVDAVDRARIHPLRELFETDDDPATGLPRLDRSASVFDFLAARGAVRLVVSEEDAVQEQATRFEQQLAAGYDEALARDAAALSPEALVVGWESIAGRLQDATRLDELGIDPVAEGDGATRDQDASHHVACQPVPSYRGRLTDWIADMRRARERGETAVFVVGSSGRAERSVELLREHDVTAVELGRAESTEGAAVLVAQGRLSQGFRLVDGGLLLVADTDVFEEERQVQDRRRAATRTFLSDFRDLKIGDHVVHVDHGIGRFVGLRRIEVNADVQEFMELRYAGEDKLFVPVERLDLVQKYSGAVSPSLDRLGGTSWEKAKTRVKKAMRDMAGELLKLYAARKAVAGHAFPPDTHWQEEFEGAFEYDLTSDQQTAIEDIKRDMEAPTPMDRLLCGDVGYGKTEVAMRGAFKAVMDGKQVAVLAPTTVLAMQHYKTLRNRFSAFPVAIDMVSRFRSKPEQQTTLNSVRDGKIDILVGTHRLLSKDVAFSDLGLLVVDEEQRFGVAHKERLKQMRKKVDVLTLSATPIPRTLNMSLAGIRDMSVIETPPRDRLAIQTSVVKFDQKIIQTAIRRELERGGQVYFVHNRVESIDSVAALLGRLVPEARLGVGHGQMSESALEQVMVDFVAHRYDVLLATTIIENGLDIPNANTMIINRADRYGLAQLYQLRGRVGRSDRRAYAYLLIPPEDALSDVARKRLAAIKEFSDLGSGFRVAMLDLEIRGAGNLLGGEQSGHIEAIGFEMYMKLLEEAVRELKGEPVDEGARATVNLKIELRIEEQYIPDMNQRLSVYRRIASARTLEEVDRLLDEVRDRYGPLPHSLLVLAGYGRLRVLADRLRIEAIERDGQFVTLRFRQDAPIDPARLMALLQRRHDVRLLPPAVLRLDLKPPLVAPRLGRGRAATGPSRPQSVSWWTARAREGAVTPGFTRENLLRQAPEDPLAEHGLFDRVGGLLEELAAAI